MRPRAGGFLLACSSLLVSGPLLGKGLLVIPSHLFVSADGDTEQTLVVKPTSQEPTLVAVGVQPFLLDPDGRPRLGARDAANRTRAEIATVEPRVLRLAGEPVTVTVRLHAPAEGGSAWAAIVLDVEPVDAGDDRGGDVSVVTRVVVPVVVTRTAPEPPLLVIEDVSARADPEGVDVTASVRNEGTSVARTYAELTIEESGAEIAQQRIEDLILFPGLSRLLRARIAVKGAKGTPPEAARRKAVVLVPVGRRLFESAAVVSP